MKDKIKTDILKKFMYSSELAYNEIWEKKLCSSSHFDYHLKKLIEENIIEKIGDKYSLTDKGTILMTTLDGESIKSKDKPVVCAFALVINKEGKILMNKRKRQPFLNHYGVPGGKVEYNETTEESAIRELREETGIIVKEIQLKLINDKITYEKSTNKVNHHIIGYFYSITDYEGELIKENREGENLWIDINDFENKKTFLELKEMIPKIINNKHIEAFTIKRYMDGDTLVEYKILE